MFQHFYPIIIIITIIVKITKKNYYSKIAKLTCTINNVHTSMRESHDQSCCPCVIHLFTFVFIHVVIIGAVSLNKSVA